MFFKIFKAILTKIKLRKDHAQNQESADLDLSQENTSITNAAGNIPGPDPDQEIEKIITVIEMKNIEEKKENNCIVDKLNFITDINLIEN